MAGKAKVGDSKGAASKGKGKAEKIEDKEEDDKAGKGKVKGCQQINVRHILVFSSNFFSQGTQSF